MLSLKQITVRTKELNMAESLVTKLGRILHDFSLLTKLNELRQMEQTAGVIVEQELMDGFARQRDTLYRSTVRRLVGDKNGGQVIHVGNAAFTIHIQIPTTLPFPTQISIPGGIVTKVYMGGFPYNTNLILLDNINAMYPVQSYLNVGAIYTGRAVVRKKARTDSRK